MARRSLLAGLAEIALEASTREEFRCQSLELACRALEMDAGAIHHAVPGKGILVHSHGLGVERLRSELVGYMNEISPAEFAQGLRGKAVGDGHVFPARRRDSLRLYREYLVPAGVFGFCARMWIHRDGTSWMTFSRQGRGARYRARDLEAIDALSPIVMVGDALHAQRDLARAVAEGRAWARDRRLTPAEGQVAELLERGLTNVEIATLLGRSPNTVRNQLAALFEKLHVSTRAELVYVLGHPEGVSLGEDAAPGAPLRTLELALQVAVPRAGVGS